MLSNTNKVMDNHGYGVGRSVLLVRRADISEKLETERESRRERDAQIEHRVLSYATFF